MEHHHQVLKSIIYNIYSPDEAKKEKKLFKQNYKLIKQLGQGSYSVVHEAENLKTHEKVAVKCINRANVASVDIDALKNEVYVMSQV